MQHKENFVAFENQRKNKRHSFRQKEWRLFSSEYRKVNKIY